MTKEEIMELIEEEDVEFIRLQFTDIFGNLKNIAITPGQLEKALDNRYSFEASAIFGGRYHYEGKLYLYPDLETFAILPWRPQQGKVAKVICDVCNEDGSIFEMGSRNVLRKVLKKAKDMGYTFMVDPECEFFLFHTDENGLPTTTTHERASYMDVGPMDFGENARREIILVLEQMGFEVESSHHEYAPAQHEIDFSEAEAMKMADSLQTFKFAVRSVAKRFGLHATFMAKPKNDVAGSGLHINLSMYKDGVNLFKSTDDTLTKEASGFIGGILKHANGLCAITNPTVNSYKRLASGFDAPTNISWSSKGESSLIKLNKNSHNTKIELRLPDGTANPYLMLASCIAAGLDGISNNLSAGEDASKCDSGVTKHESLPTNLKEAIIEMEKDEVITSVLGDEMAKIFAEIKYNEWNDYMMEVSDWEINRYLMMV